MYLVAQKLINQACKIIVIQAENPDGDSLGSALALEEILSVLGKEVKLYCPVEIPKYLRYIDGWDRVESDFSTDADLAIIVDTTAELLLSKVLETPGKPESAQFFAFGKRNHILLFLFLRSECFYRIGSERSMRRQNHSRAAVDSGKLLDRYRVTQHIGPRTAVLFVVRQSHKSEFRHLLYRFVRKFIFPVEFKCDRLDFLLSKFSHLGSEILVSLRRSKKHKSTL